MDELASQSLELVNRELSSTLETARGEIEDYVDGNANTEALIRAASLLHLVAGALKIVEIHGAAMLAEEMEQTCRAIHEGTDVSPSSEAAEALTRAMVQLPAYLERLMSGGSDVALVLLPLLNDLRTVRGQPMLSEGTLLLLNTGPFERFRQTEAASQPAPAFTTDVPALAQKLRPEFQSALLRWIRGEASDGTIDALIRIANELEDAAQSEPVRQLFAVTAGVLIAVQNGDFEASVSLKRLVGQADRQLKRLIDSGEQAFISAPPVDLMNSLLYYVARATSDDERITELRQTFGVDTTIPGAEEIEQAREDMAGPSVKLMRTVAEAIKEDLTGVKDVLDIFVRTGMENIAELAPQLDMLKKIGDTLGVLGLESARAKIQSESEQLEAIVSAGSIDDARALEGIATSLLDVEDMLDRELVRSAPVESRDDEKTDESLDSSQYRHVTTAVMRECIVNLAKIKEVVVKVLDDPEALRSLDQIEPQMRGIVAGLLMLNKNRAVNVIERIGRTITTRLEPGSKALKPRMIERLADAIVSIEYYMETLALGRSDPFYMLDNANRCLDLLDEPTAATATSTEVESDAAAETIVDDATDVDPEMTAVDQRALSVMNVAPDGSEPELVEVFIEEAKEEIEKIREALPRWIDQPEDQEALIAVRRSFHTLKGSGRVIGAELIGEFAWSVENLLNRIINRTLAATQPMFDLVSEAAKVLPQLVEQLEIGIAPSADVTSLIYRAESLVEGRELDGEEDLLSQSTIAPAMVMDPVLQQIFVKETREHLGAIKAFATAAMHAPVPVPITEPLHRACHTLHGSAKMANCVPAIELTKPLEAAIRRGFEAKTGLGVGAVAVLAKFATELERLCNALEGQQDFVVNPDIVAAVESIAIVEPQPAEEAADAVDDMLSLDEISLEQAPNADELTLAGEPGFDVAAFVPQSEETAKERAIEPAGDEGEATAAEVEVPTFEPPAEAAAAPTPPAEAPTPPVEAAMPPAEAPVEAVADYDPEIAAIFCEEALELLEQAETELQSLKQHPNSDTALNELKRGLHTLKGGARLAGIATMGDLSHALETLIPKFSNAANHEAGLKLVQQGLDRLHQMRDAVDAGQAAASAPDLIAQFENFGVVGVEAAPAESVPMEPAAPEAPEQAPAEPEPATDQTQIQRTLTTEMLSLEPEQAALEPEQPSAVEAPPSEETKLQPAGELESAEPASAAPPAEPETLEPEAPVPPAEEPVAESLEEAPVETPAAEPAPAAPAAAARVERADVARVDAVLLDELLNEAGEISIFQSRLKQQIQSVEFHLGELGQTVTRLREQLRSLESETEAQILHRHQGDIEGDEQFDPLELDRYSTIQQLSRALAETSNDVASINDLLRGLTSEADTLLTQQSRVTTELQDGLMQTRMVPFDRHASRLARIVRQAADDSGKRAELNIDGAQSQLDRQILDAILPALEHLLRNAVIHGIESKEARAKAGKPEVGIVSLNVRRDGAEVLIDVGDDGSGLDTNGIRRKAIEKGIIQETDTMIADDIAELILLPGFSTADELTQSAGRGVGLDVVDNEVKRLGGSLRITSEPGRGTHFLIRLPYTLAITHALIVDVGEETFALPLPTIEGIARVRREELLEILKQDHPRLVQGDGSYRVQHLGSLVGGPPSALPEDEGAVSLVLVRAGENSAALLTDTLEGSREIIVKTLGPHIASVDGVTGATILGDGRVVVILDAGTLVRAQQSDGGQQQPEKHEEPAVLTGLVVDDSITMRRVTQRLLERRGVRVHTARDGLDAIEVLREHEADFIVLDIEMPRMDGYQFATHVRNDPKLKELPIIMVTSRSGEKHRARAIEIGVNDYLSKPYQEAQLIAAIEALVGRSI